jgi:hypothetical protein
MKILPHVVVTEATGRSISYHMTHLRSPHAELADQAIRTMPVFTVWGHRDFSSGVSV